jgi:hypothetical protein
MRERGAEPLCQAVEEGEARPHITRHAMWEQSRAVRSRGLADGVGKYY